MYNNNNKYTGQFVDGFKEGRGIFSIANGDEYVGEFVRGRRHGHGIETYQNGEKYVGEYEEDLQNGQGAAYYSNSAIKYVGEWREVPMGQIKTLQKFT